MCEKFQSNFRKIGSTAKKKKFFFFFGIGGGGGGGVPRVTKTLAAWQHCCAEILAVWWTLRKISQKYTQNFFRVLHCFFLEKNLKYLCHFVAKLAQKCMFLCLKYSTNKCFVRKFSIKFGLFENFHKKQYFLENFHKNSLYWKISTIICFVLNFPQKYALLANFYKKIGVFKSC